MARRSHRPKRSLPASSAAQRRRSPWSTAASVSAAIGIAGLGLWAAAQAGWLPFVGAAPRPGVSLIPSRTSIPLPSEKKQLVFGAAPTASGKSEASTAVFACIERLHVNDDILQPLRRELDYQIWPNPDFSEVAKSARYLFRLREQVMYAADGPRLIAEIRTCTAQP